MTINDIMLQILEWLWGLIMGVKPLIEWLFTPIEILDFSVSPIWLIGGGAGALVLIAGILRAIL